METNSLHLFLDGLDHYTFRIKSVFLTSDPPPNHVKKASFLRNLFSTLKGSLTCLFILIFRSNRMLYQVFTSMPKTTKTGEKEESKEAKKRNPSFRT